MRQLIRFLCALAAAWVVLSASLASASAARLDAPAAPRRSQAVITFNQQNKPRIYAFITRNGHLYVNYWDGSGWYWADQGMPPGSVAVGTPGVLTYLDGLQQRIYAFVVGSNGHLYTNYWDGSGWYWADQGTPAGTTVTDTPSVISFWREGGQRIYVFVRGADGRLYVNLWNGSGWSWSDHGPPPGTSTASAPGVITYVDSTDQSQRIYAFVQGANGRLYVNYMDGIVWKWADQGLALGALVGGTPGVITYREYNLPQQIYAFVRGQNGRLYVNYWNGGTWTWADQGLPPGTTTSGAPGVISYNSSGPGSTLIYAFVRGQNGRLYVNYWSGGTWTWADQGTPLFTTVSSSPDVITYRDGILPQCIYAFARATNDQLYVNAWDGSVWAWDNHGTP